METGFFSNLYSFSKLTLTTLTKNNLTCPDATIRFNNPTRQNRSLPLIPLDKVNTK